MIDGWVRRAAMSGLLAGMFALGACHEPVRELRPLPQATLPDFGVGEVTVTYAAANDNPTVAQNLREALAEIAQTCGAGPNKYKVDVRIDNFKGQNPGATIFIGDKVQLAGLVRLTNTQTNDLVGEYYIDEMRAGSGLIGAALLSGSDRFLPRNFAQRICTDILRRKAPPPPTPGAGNTKS